MQVSWTARKATPQMRRGVASVRRMMAPAIDTPATRSRAGSGAAGGLGGRVGGGGVAGHLAEAGHEVGEALALHDHMRADALLRLVGVAFAQRVEDGLVLLERALR